MLMEQSWNNAHGTLSRFLAGRTGFEARPGGIFPLDPPSGSPLWPPENTGARPGSLFHRQAAPGSRGAELDACPQQKLFRVNSVLILREYA